MCMCVSKSAESLFQNNLVRIGVSVQAQEIHLRLRLKGIRFMCVVASFAEEKTRSVGIFVCIKKDVLAIVFVVAEKSVGVRI